MTDTDTDTCAICLNELLPPELSYVFHQHLLEFAHKYHASVTAVSTELHKQKTLQLYVQNPDTYCELKHQLLRKPQESKDAKNNQPQIIGTSERTERSESSETWIEKWLKTVDVGNWTQTVPCGHSFHAKCLFAGTDHTGHTGQSDQAWWLLPKCFSVANCLTECPLCRQPFVGSSTSPITFNPFLPSTYVFDDSLSPNNVYGLKEHSLVWIQPSTGLGGSGGSKEFGGLKSFGGFGCVGKVVKLEADQVIVQMIWPEDLVMWSVPYQNVFDLLCLVSTHLPLTRSKPDQKSANWPLSRWPYGWQARYTLFTHLSSSQVAALEKHMSDYLAKPHLWSHTVLCYLLWLALSFEQKEQLLKQYQSIDLQHPEVLRQCQRYLLDKHEIDAKTLFHVCMNQNKK